LEELYVSSLWLGSASSSVDLSDLAEAAWLVAWRVSTFYLASPWYFGFPGRVFSETTAPLSFSARRLLIVYSFPYVKSVFASPPLSYFL